MSCNVYFGQLGLKLGPDGLKSLRDAGVEMGWGGRTGTPGKAGSRDLASTAFGQAASLWSVSQAARLVAAVGGGGVYRRCPPSLDMKAQCEETKVVDDPARVGPILSGMFKVMANGTGTYLKEPEGVRVYGKTGTADSIGIKDEIPWGVEFGDVRPPALVVHRPGRADGHDAVRAHQPAAAGGGGGGPAQRDRRQRGRPGGDGDPGRGAEVRVPPVRAAAAAAAGAAAAPGGDGTGGRAARRRRPRRRWRSCPDRAGGRCRRRDPQRPRARLRAASPGGPGSRAGRVALGARRRPVRRARGGRGPC